MNRNKFKQWRKSAKGKTSLALMITAGVLLELISGIQYYFAHEGIQEEVQQRAQSELEITSLRIKSVMRAIEVSANDMAWMMEQNLFNAEYIYEIEQRLVADNANLVGVGMAFEPNYFPEKGRWYEPYAARRESGVIETAQIGSETHDYLNQDWYLEATKNGRWSEPYYDDSGSKSVVTSYTLPIYDANGKKVGVIAMDISLQWLSAIINETQSYPSSYNVMISREGLILAFPVEGYVMEQTVQEATRNSKDTMMRTINRNMMAGESGQATVTDDNGQKNYVFYGPVDENTGWSMAVVCPDKEIFYNLRQVGFNLMLLMLAGMFLLLFILWRSSKAFSKLEEVNAEKERIGSELRIARGIQEGMLPKTFPPYPDREDVAIYGTLVPAKEVGGDLYDFYVRDEKLFFCIGDVSGKGVPASLMMAVTRSLFRTSCLHDSMPSKIISSMNNAIAEMNEANMFVTLFIGVLDLPTGRLRYCNGGHNEPLLLCGKEARTIPVHSNLPVGILQGMEFEQQETMIEYGNSILLYTDGLTEAENDRHEQFGFDRLNDVASQIVSKNPSEQIQVITDAVSSFVGSAQQSDDLTLMTICYLREATDIRMQKRLILPNDINEVPQLNSFIDEIAEELGLDMGDAMNLNLALEEAVVNVMLYAYPKGTQGQITIDAVANSERLKLVITDEGAPFDPTVRGEVDINKPLEERQVGGLGIHLIRQIMDSVNYERVEGKNVLTLRKKLER